ncbi:MAG: TIM-barrel domain-containing protein [bacterium]
MIPVCCGEAIPVSEYERAENGLILKMQPGKMKIEVCAENILHIVYTPIDKFPERKSLMIVDKPRPSVKWDLKEDKDFVSLTTNKIQAEVSMKTGAITFYYEDGVVVLREPAAGGKTMTEADVLGEDVYHAEQSFVLSADEGLYGLGQYQEGIMNYRGHDVLLAQANTVAVVPFLLSTNGYGILWDNYSLTKFHDGEDGTYFWSEVADAIDYYFIYGPDADDIIAGYRELTGYAPMFGKWAYGYWQCKERYKTQDELTGVAKEYRERRLPLDSIVQDWQYWGDLGWNAMDFDRKNFPDPEGMIRELHEKYHLHVMISVWTKFGPETPIYKEMKNKGYLYSVPDSHGSYTYDAFNGDARKIYWDHIKKGFFSKGMDAWWLDVTEPEFDHALTQEHTIEMMKSAERTALGSTARYLNAYSLMTTKGVYEGQRETTSDKRVFILARSAFAGQQRHAAVTWSGDILSTWDVFRKQISAGLNFSMAGIPYWTTDIGGFTVKYGSGRKNDEFRELYVRWFQYGAFCPIFRSHGSSTPREIWQFGEPKTWAYDTLEKFDILRYRMLPYIYSLAWKVTSEGYTIMRGLPFDFRSDPNILGIDDQFMFGPAILVNPVTKPMYHIERLTPSQKMLKEKHDAKIDGRIIINKEIRSRSVYLPEAAAGWYDFWTGKFFAGGQTIEAPAPIDIMPLYVKGGSIIPMGPELQYAAEKPADPIELRIYPGADADFIIYEDEGDNYNYEKGVYSIIPLKWNESARSLTIGQRIGSFPGMLTKRTFNIILVTENRGVGVQAVEKPDRIVTYTGDEITINFK